MSRVAEPISIEEEKRRRAVYAKRMTDADAAKELGITKSCYAFWRRLRNLPAAHPRVVKKATLCWKCKNANRFKCTWFDPDNQQPVEGWDADEEVLKLTAGKRKDGTTVVYVTETYRVRACPNFEEEE